MPTLPALPALPATLVLHPVVISGHWASWHQRLSRSVLSLLSILLLLIMMLAASRAAQAQEIPAHIRLALPEARLAGQGGFTWFGLSIYDATLYVGPQGYVPGQRFVLDLRYARSLQGARIAKASIEQMQKVGVGTQAQHAQWFTSMQAIFPDVQEGTHLTAIFSPQAATRFLRDGQPLAEIADPEYGPAFAAIWLSPATTAPKLRTQLLRDAAPRP